MLRLHGGVSSPYFNKVKLVLLDKHIPFETVPTSPSQDPGFLNLSPMGKVPFIETGDGFVLAESQAICEYLEESYPVPLLPGDAGDRGRARELASLCELYVAYPFTRMYAHVLFGAQMAETEKQDIAKQIMRGIQALEQRMQGPFLAGPDYTLADVVVAVHLQPIRRLMLDALNLDPLMNAPRLSAWLEMICARPNFAEILRACSQAHEELASR